MRGQAGCDQVRLAQMALMDGEAASLTREQVQAHLAECEECRSVAEGQQALHERLSGVSLARPVTPELWPSVAPRLTQPRPAYTWGLAAAAAVVALVRLVLVILGAGGGLWLVHALPLVVAVVVLGAFRLNPFRIEPTLVPAAEPADAS